MPTGVLLINIGTPDLPTPGSVGDYLSEFLLDPYVTDIPFIFRYPLVKWVILPKRSVASASLYQTIWTERGSPLLIHAMDLAASVQKLLGERYRVRTVMRYGNPGIENTVREMLVQGITQLIAFPLYPQYSLATTHSALEKLRCHTKTMVTKVIPPFFNRDFFVNAFATRIQESLKNWEYDKLLFSFHGLPKAHVTKLHRHCESSPNCCDRVCQSNALCYRAQSFETARLIAERLGLKPHQYEVAFQSRLTNRWIVPFSDKRYTALPAEGVRNLAVVCPSFVADCLETLEEVQLRGQRTFQNAGGYSLKLVPSLNSEPYWAKGVADTVRGLHSAGFARSH